MREKISNILEKIFGIGIFILLFAGGLTAFFFVAALIIGGETGEALACFMQKKVLSIIVYSSSVLVLLGLVKMYISGEHSLTMKK